MTEKTGVIDQSYKGSLDEPITSERRTIDIPKIAIFSGNILRKRCPLMPCAELETLLRRAILCECHTYFRILILDSIQVHANEVFIMHRFSFMFLRDDDCSCTEIKKTWRSYSQERQCGKSIGDVTLSSYLENRNVKNLSCRYLHTPRQKHRGLL